MKRKHNEARKQNELQTISEFFHPLDGIQNWNRIYGSDGFIQYQFVVPDSSVQIITWTLEKLRRAGAPTFLNVLKRFGPSNLSPLSFPIEGWTLAIDIPANFKGLMSILDEIDNKVISSGGRIYLAKDSRQSKVMFTKTYQKLSEWKKIKNKLDPKNIFTSDLAERIGL